MVLCHGYHYEHQTLQTTQPYLFYATSTSIGINGAVTLKKTALSYVSVNNLAFQGLWQKKIITIDDVQFSFTYKFEDMLFTKTYDTDEILALRAFLEHDPILYKDPEECTHYVVRRRICTTIN